MKHVCSWLGKNLDAAIADAVEFSRKRILVDADLANRRFRRQRSTGETIDVDLAAVRAGRGSCESGQLVRQLVRIVGERIEILALEHDRTGIASGIRADFWRAFLIGDGYALFRGFNRH